MHFYRQHRLFLSARARGPVPSGQRIVQNLVAGASRDRCSLSTRSIKKLQGRVATRASLRCRRCPNSRSLRRRLAVRHPEIRELDINPLIVDETGVLAVDARVRIADNRTSPRMPVAIRPYPLQWETRFEIAEVGSVEVRPVRPDDERLYQAFSANVSAEDVRMRFFTPRVALSHQFLARHESRRCRGVRSRARHINQTHNVSASRSAVSGS